MLCCSGLIAGASILGILAAMLGFMPGFDRDTGLHPTVAVLPQWFPGSRRATSSASCILALLGFLMFRGAAEPKGVTGDSR